MTAGEERWVARAHLKQVERAARKVAQEREALRVAIVLARDAGETFEDIARAAGLSRQRISQIVNERRT